MGHRRQLLETMKASPVCSVEKMSNRIAVRYNPNFQHVCYGFRFAKPHDLRTLFHILIEALKSYKDLTLIEEVIWTLWRLQLLLTKRKPLTLKFLFWLAVAVLHLNEESLFAAGLALLQQNLIKMHDLGLFQKGTTLSNILMKAQEPMEEYMTQLEHHCGLSFRTNFDVALAATVVKGYQHTSPATRDRTLFVLCQLLGMTADVHGCGVYEVNVHTAPYLAAMALQSEKVLSRCPFKPYMMIRIVPMPHPTQNQPTGDSSSVGTKTNALMNSHTLNDIDVQTLVVAMLAKMGRNTEDKVASANLLNYLKDAEIAFPVLTPLVSNLWDKKFADEMSRGDSQDRTGRLRSILQTGRQHTESSTLRICSLLLDSFSGLWTNAEAFTEIPETRTIAGIIASILDSSAEAVVVGDFYG